MHGKDDIYALPLNRVGSFVFDDQVVRVFPDMIARSVPGYASILAMIGELSATYAVENSNVYDLGCSLGAATFLMQDRVPTSCTIRAIDSSPAMVAALTNEIAARESRCSIEVAEADIRDVDVERASLSVLNFTLQFVPQSERSTLLTKIAAGTIAGGALVLSEKVCFDDPLQQQLMTDLHHDFKRANGYSELEIAQKRSALEETLVPETIETHVARLHDAGFSTAACWFQCFNFVSILAVK